MKGLKTILGGFLLAGLISQSASASVILLDTFDSFSPDWTVDTTFTLGNAGISSSDTSPAPSGNPYGYVEAAASILNTTTIYRSISTLGYTNIGLDFYYKTTSANEHLIDFTQFRWRETGDLLWNTFDINATDWTYESLTLSGVANSSVDVAFRVRNVLDDDTPDWLYLDDLRLTGDLINGNPPPGPTPVPEPMTMALFGTGLAGLALRRKKS